MRRIREVVRSGELGRVYAVDLVFHNAYGPDKPWFYDPALAGGGCVMDLGVHLVDLALWVLDFPEVPGVSAKLFAGGEPLGGRPDRVEDYAVATLKLGTGAAMQLACSWRLQAGCAAIISAAFYGTNGGAALRNVDGSFYDSRPSVIAAPRAKPTRARRTPGAGARPLTGGAPRRRRALRPRGGAADRRRPRPRPHLRTMTPALPFAPEPHLGRGHSAALH